MTDYKYQNPPNDPLFIECVKTPLSRQELAYYLREGWKCIYKEYPSLNSLSILWGQVMLETGGTMLRCFNYGNIKKGSHDTTTKYTSYLAGEYINGKHYLFYPYHPQTFFAAWETALDGAIGYIKFLSGRSRYVKAWQALINGDPKQYCIELKNGGYYTAPLEHYMKNVVLLTNTFKNHSDEYLSWAPPTPLVEVEKEPGPIVEPPPAIVKEHQADSVEEELVEPEELPVPKEPENDITDKLPGTDEEKINRIYLFFITLWTYILQILTYFKK